MHARARQLFSQKQFKSFLVSPISAPQPLPPPDWKKEEEEEEEEEMKSKDKFNCVEFHFQISRRSIRKVQISQSNTSALLSLEVSGELPWQWLLLSLNTLTHFLC